MLRSDMIAYCPVTPSYIDAANKIFGHEIPYLRGKTVSICHMPEVTHYMTIPNHIKYMIWNLTVAADVMFVRRLSLLVSISRGLKLTTVEYMPKRTDPVLYRYLGMIYDSYFKHGYTVDLFMMER